MVDVKSGQSVENVNQEEQDIIRRIIAGEKSLFEKLIRANNQKLFRVIRSYIKDEDEVRDAMQEVYLSAYVALPKFRMDASFSTWLTRIGINEAYKRLRKINHIEEFETDEINERVIETSPVEINYQSPDKVFIRQETHQLLMKAIDELPEKYRIVYVMREVEGMDGRETADHLDISESNVKVRLHRAKDMLKDFLSQTDIDHSVLYEFGNHHCDAMADTVMQRIHEG